MKKRSFSGLLGITLLILSGCNQKDKEKLGNIGRMVGSKMETAILDIKEELLKKRGKSSQPTKNVNFNSETAQKVSERLNNDSELKDSKIEVSEVNQTIVLKGRVGDLQQKRRAVNIAETTVGVKSVQDLLRLNLE